MNIIQAIVLGIVEGLTEFIPVSSTAHLILVEKIMTIGWGFGAVSFAFNVLILASLPLFIGERIGKRARALETATWLDALVVGLAQALALVPGVSRSGATISVALMRDFERASAARFSFLMSLPALIGASV